uniref:Transmembrane protein 198 n=1 Tax=Meleagris gallopavo TaxID=9103 RepID=A0A803XNZ1_MELGA
SVPITPSAASQECLQLPFPWCCHRCFKAIMFTSGLLLGSSTIFLLCYKERVLETRLSLEVSAGIALAIGSLCGLVTALLRSVGLFSTGLLLGLLLATAVLAAAAPLVPPLSPWVLVGVLLGPALLCALLALRWPKALTTLATAVLGAAVVVACVDYFVEVFALVLHVSERLRMAAVGQLCWYSWVVLGVWPALSLLGVLLQQRPLPPLLYLHQQEAKCHVCWGSRGCPTTTTDTPFHPQSYIQSLWDLQLENAAPPDPAGTPSDGCGSTVSFATPVPRGHL